MKTVALHTLGCRLNFSETGSVAQGFEQRGYRCVDFPGPADVVFINTCTVTDNADSTCRNLIRKAYRANPEAKIVVAGCYAQMDAPRIAAMTGVDLVLGTSEKYKVFDYLEQEQENKIFIDKTATFYGAATSSAEGHTRAFLKIQDGCNYVCSYCIIPQARGRSRAISISEALERTQALAAQGFKEVVITGVNIGEYEHTTGERLPRLIEEISKVKGIERLRLSSVEPNTISDDLLSVFKSSDKFLDHFHIPLQSGDDDILKKMRRKYDLHYYEGVMQKIMDAFPNAAIGADVIVGHPGESEEHFQNTYRALSELPITHFHVFPFSKRKNTLSAKMEDQIQHHVKKERARLLIKLGEQKLKDFAEEQVGTHNRVLFERRNKEGLWEGYTTNFVRVKVDTPRDLHNQIHPVELVEMRDGQLMAELI